MDRSLVLYDGLAAKDTTQLTTFNTSIDIKNLETGEIIFKNLKNKVIISGSGLIARKLFDISSGNVEITPSYNEAFGDAMYTPASEITLTDFFGTNATKDNPKILLFCCGIDGCGTENSQVYPVDYKKWIAPENLIPFRYQLAGNDLSEEMRLMYFGRTDINGEYLAYYFKRFEGSPVLVQQYIDGTPVDSSIFKSGKTEPAETYVEINLKITKEDIRDYFINTVGIDEARINSISLCYAYPVEENGHVYFKDIRPLTKLNIPNEQLIDMTKGIEIIYHIYM